MTATIDSNHQAKHDGNRFCQLCGARDPQQREGRLGRYGLTCDACEATRGRHLH